MAKDTDSTAKPTAAADSEGPSATSEHKIGDKSFDLTPDQIIHVNTIPSAGTVEDPAGIERIVVPNIESGWRPAPVEPNEDEVARLEVLRGALEAKKAERLDALKV